MIMLPRWFTSLLVWDRVLIVCYIFFMIFLIAALIVMSAPQRRRRMERKLTGWANRLEALTASMRDDEPFDAEWMDAEKWRRTRP